MKHTVTILVLAAIVTGTSNAAITGRSSGFMDKRQLASWRVETIPKSGEAEQNDAVFFTGKPYLASTDEFAFKYRSYNPSFARWTSEDPSGFPDGANSNHYAPCPLSEFDFEGLMAWKIRTVGPSAVGTNNGVVAVDSRQSTITAKASIGSNSNAIPSPTLIPFSLNGSGKITNNLPLSWPASFSANFEAKVDSTGKISITPSSGSWSAPNNDLQVAGTWSTSSTGAHTEKLQFDVSSIYQGTGLSGAGVLGASLSWTGGSGLVSAFATIEFEAYE